MAPLGYIVRSLIQGSTSISGRIIGRTSKGLAKNFTFEDVENVYFFINN